ELRLVKNINLIFENMNPLINTSLTAFKDRFLELECSMVTWGDTYFIAFNAYFEPSLENETAKFYTDEIISEFMTSFGYSGLNLLWKNQMVKEGKMWVHKSFGFIPRSREGVLTFLKFAPKNGFAKFIDQLLEKYIPGNATTGLIPHYFVKRVNSGCYLDLVITGTSSVLLPSWEPRDYSYSISLKELLNTDSSIVEQPLEYQQIIIRYEKVHTELLSRGNTTYTIDIDSIQPEGYNVAPDEWPNWVDIIYSPLSPMEDVVIEMTINSYVQRQTPPWTWPIIAMIVLLTAFAVLLYIVKKRKGGEKVDREDFR
ncbi:MAG: hypothetical protein ACPLYF_04690, partial [Fervidobacterium sp.]